ncbi:MAG: DsrE family protein [Marinicella sp.]|nr:DsrE family protein [Xanthomonadales bacterium]
MKILFSIFILLLSQCVYAQSEQFKTGPAIENYGQVAKVDGMQALPENTKFKVSFDVYKMAEPGQLNRAFDSVARFINMHVANGVRAENIELAVVVHGGSVKEMTPNDFYKKQTGAENANIELIQQLQKQGVSIYVCGQSATYHGVKSTDLLPGVEMSLSAMTAHALLQQQGYTLNPF